jgi:SAM-dependent methyltransferase
MEQTAFESLLRPDGRTALAAAVELEPVEDRFLVDFKLLCHRFPRELARVALETAILRRKAFTKFGPDAHSLYFTRESLEQATAGEVAAYRAGRFEEFSAVADLGCSVGGDTIPLARRAAGKLFTVGIELDPLRIRMARANVEALGLGAGVGLIRADLTGGLPLLPGPETGLFFDPARRGNGRRIHRVRDYRPPLTVVDEWLGRFPALAVKISPAVRDTDLAGMDAEIEFISLRGELKEAVLWFGPLRQEVRRATVLPGPFSLAGTPDNAAGPLRRPARLATPKVFLIEPDSAVIRAGLVRLLAEDLDAYQLDPVIAYLTADHSADCPFARFWPVEDWMPFNLKRLRRYLRERDVGRVTVQKRGSPLDPATLTRDLRLKGDAEKRLVLTHLDGRPIVLICGDQK